MTSLLTTEQQAGERRFQIVVWAVGAVLALYVVMGIAAQAMGGGRLAAFDLDEEGTFGSNLSGWLLLGAAVALALSVRRWRITGYAWVMVALFAFTSVDESWAFHEALEHHVGVDWQVLYLPILVVALWASWFILRSLYGRADPLPFWLYLTGGAAIVISQVLEFAEWNGDLKRQGYAIMMVTEETLEALGAACFFLAFLRLLWSAPAVERVSGPRASVEA